MGPAENQPATHLAAEDLEELLPELIIWVGRVEERALGIGTPLDTDELRVAQRAGVSRGEGIRLLFVDTIPVPKEPEYAEAFSVLGLGDLNGITYGRAIFVKLDAPNHAGVVAHELKHAAQYERLGIDGFLRQFSAEINQYSYREAPLEREAIQFATDEGYPDL